MKKCSISVSLFALLTFLVAGPLLAQDPHPGDPGYAAPAEPTSQTASHVGSSPFNPPEENDQTFVVDQGGGLDTGCTFRSGGPLVFSIKVGRVVGDVAKLKANGLIGDEASLSMPAFDVDFDANVSGINPERDRVTFNGHPVNPEFLGGSNNVWRLNEFRVPIEWVNFPADPGNGGTPTDQDNTIEIEIDTANVGAGEFWCTAIDWAALTIEVARPVILVHGIFSEGAVWGPVWVSNLNNLGLPNSNALNLGALGSIGGNAAQIASEVASRRQQWGVDKVVLVGHSKGGLDSRQYVENNDDVEQVVQIGTPNAGSPLADAVQAALLRAGLLPSIILNGLVAAFSGPAGIQLTTGYMVFIYNPFHGSNPMVRYTALAGDYDPNCFALNPLCRPIQRLLLAISGSPGDTIVPVYSVHALGYTNNRSFASAGANQDATHACLPGFNGCQLSSQGVFNSVSDRVSAFGTNLPTTSPPPGPTFFQTATEVASIQQGQTVDRVLYVDEPKETFFSLFFPSGDLDLVLISPSGQLIDPSVAASDPASVSFESGGALGGLLEVYDIATPEVGAWTLRVSAPLVDDPSGEAGFFVNAWLREPAIRLHGGFADNAVRSGNPLTLLGTLLENGAPLLGASASALVSVPDGTTVSVTLTDDGSFPDETAADGVYTGQLLTTAAGNYAVSFSAGGTGSSGNIFSREAFALATASASGTSFAGAFRDSGVDTDGNGLFNRLDVEVDLDVTDEGDYRVFGILSDSSGNTHQANLLSHLQTGSQTVTLGFDGQSFFQNGIDGPYTLATLRLAEEEGLSLMPLAELADAHQTAPYSFNDFEHEALTLTGSGTSTGRDTNGNGLFDFLDVSIGVSVDNSGFYQWSGRLVDSDGTELGFVASSGFFSAGLNNVTMSFPGQPIGENAVDGPYFVNDLLVFGAGSSLVSLRAFTTDAFAADQFEGFAGDMTPPTLEVTLEPNVLWPPNHRLVEIQATIIATDDTDPTPEVSLVSIESNEPDDGLGDGDKPDDIQDAAFGTDDRTFKLRAERSGLGNDRQYSITYQAVDDAGNVTLVTVVVTAPHDFGNN